MNFNYLPPGYLLNQRYSIQKTLGQGGFGITYLAYDSRLAHEVCIKELFISGYSTRGSNNTVHSQTNEAFSFQNFVGRFIHEAQQLVLFSHPNIVRVFDIFEHNQTAYMVMEFVAGETLKHKIQREGAMDATDAIKLFDQLLDAVEEVHRKGMLHRDIKPDNIMLTPGGRLVLIDFGSARDFTEGQTSTQTAMVTPGYAPPEQYSTRNQRGTYTDIYALGATLYYLLTGEKPIAATERQLEELVPPHEIKFDINLSISRAIIKSMELRPVNRFQQVKEFRAKMAESPKSPKPPNPTKWLDHLMYGLLFIFMMCMVLIYVNYLSKPTAEEKARAEAEAQRIADSMMQAMEAEKAAAEEAATASQQNNSSILNKLLKDMAYVAGGTFTMGCTAEQADECNGSEKPAHQVILNAFFIGKYEVTQAQWYEVMGNNPSYFSGCNNCPVEKVSWNEVQDFIRKLNQKTGKNFRLPTEAEWEFAARGGNQSRAYKYAGSDNINEVAWYYDNAGNKTHPVGQKSPNELGLYDMSGNVWEWCNDWYGNYTSTGDNNPSGPVRGSYRVFRGGSWNYGAIHCRSAYRINLSPDDRDNFIGFRLVSPK